MSSAFFIFLVTLLSLVINGYYFNIIDHAFYLTYLNKIENSSLYLGDYLFSQAHLNYSLFNNFTVFMKKLFHIDYAWLYLLFFLISLFLSYYALFLLTSKFTKGNKAPFLAIIFFLAPKWVASVGHFTHARLFMPRDLALALALLTINFLLEKNFLISTPLLILCLIINPPIVPPLLLFYIYILVKKLKLSFKKLFFSSLIILSLLVSILPNHLQKLVEGNPMDMEWFQIMQKRGSYSFPLLWRYTGWGNLFLFVSIMIFSILFFKRKLFGKYQKSVLSFLLISVLFFLLHTAFSSILPLPFLIQFQLLRSLTFITVFSLISFAIFLESSLEQKNNLYKIIAIAATLCVYLWGDHLTLWHFLILGFFIEFSFFPKKNSLKIPFPSLKINFPFLLLLFISLHGFLIIYLKKPAINLPYYLATPSFYTKLNEEKYCSWMETQLWAKNNTSPKSIFLTPPYLQGFRVFSQRTIVGESKDGGVIFYSVKYAKEWKKRMADLFEYFTNQEENILLLQKKYQFSYLAVEKDKFNLPFPKVFENSLYIIYDFKKAKEN